jgi:hypothetical protein
MTTAIKAGEKREPGRPPKDIDWELVKKLAQIACTDEEIAAIVGVSHETLVRRKREPEIAEMILQARSKGKASLRRIQYQLAENGNAAMAIFLGKNWLGQRDKVEDQPVDLGPLPWTD